MRTVPKPWGREEIFAENERYAGKVLHLSGGHSLSLQYHERKDEPLYVLEGDVLLEVEEEGTMRQRLDDVVRLEDDYGREGTKTP